jgi:hypothetical protein
MPQLKKPRGAPASLGAQDMSIESSTPKSRTTGRRLRRLWPNNLSCRRRGFKHCRFFPPIHPLKWAEQAREERRRGFEKRLVENPEAFVLYQTSYYLQRFQERVRAERVARAAK